MGITEWAFRLRYCSVNRGLHLRMESRCAGASSMPLQHDPSIISFLGRQLFSFKSGTSYIPASGLLPINSTWSVFSKLFHERFMTTNREQPDSSSSLLDEREFHKLADELLHHLQEKIEEFGEECDIDGFDIDHAEGVLTIKLGILGTYVINKQTPNRQIWLSSPVSGPARFDWDAKDHCWVYRRTKSEIFQLLENEMQELLGASVTLSK